LKHKKTVLFSDYTIPPATARQKNDCITAALDSMSTVQRGETLFDQIKTQFGYVGPWFWLGVAAILIVLLCIFNEIQLLSVTPDDTFFPTMALFSASGPVIACLSAPVLARSYTNDMWELEEASFYNLPRLTALRLFICALSALPVIVLLAALGFGVTGFIQGLAVLIGPFLLTSGLNYVILGRLRGVAGSFCSIGLGLLLAILCSTPFLIMDNLRPLLRAEAATALSLIAIFACVLFFLWSARHLIRKSLTTQ